MSLSGNLKTVSFPDILQLLATGKKTGTLEIETNTRKKEIAFRGGNIIYASSVNNNEDLLGTMLLRRGRISKAELDRAVAMHQQTGRQLGTTLIDMNLFTKEEIAECLRLQVEEIVYNLFAWKEGEFNFCEGREIPDLPFQVNLVTMNVVMEGTRRVDEWTEIQKVLPPDDALLALVEAPPANQAEVRLSTDEFRLLVLINGERTLPDLVRLSPMGEFVTYRAVYRLINHRLVEIAGRRAAEPGPGEDEEEVLLSMVFRLFNRCFFEIRTLVTQFVGEDNRRFVALTAQHHKGLGGFFTGAAPDSPNRPSFEHFLKSVRAVPVETRYYQLLHCLESMLTEQLEFVYQLLGDGAYRRAASNVKKQIAEPLSTRRELVRRYRLEDSLYSALRHAERVVKLVRG